MNNWLYKIVVITLCITTQLYPAAHNKVNNSQGIHPCAWKYIESKAAYSAACHWVSKYPEPQSPHFKAAYEALRSKYGMSSSESEDKKAALKAVRAQNISRQELIKKIDRLLGNPCQN